MFVPGWRQNQVLIILVLIALAWLLRKSTEPRLQDWARSREGWPKWRLRLIVQIRRRLFLIWFSIIAGLVYLVMQNVTWPSRSYLIGLSATLSTVWFSIGLAAQLVRNRTLRRTVRWFLWIYATLYFLNALDEIAAFLDRLAIEFGETRISALSVISALVILGVLFAGARLLSRMFTANVRKNQDISPSMQELTTKGVQLLLYGLAFYIGAQAIGLDLTGLAFLYGIIGVGLGFGLQTVVSNLVSGVIILLDKSIKPGDVISLGDTFGWIESLSARYVSVKTREGLEYLIPNEDLIANQVVNWTHSNQLVRLDIYFGTAYDDDPHTVRALAIEASSGVKRVLVHPNAPVCHIVGFGDSSVDYILRFWIGDPTAGLTNVRGNVYLALWDIFKENDISIPFPQREVRLLHEPEAEVSERTDTGNGAPG
ncbi:mechanosensitive ion channel [Sedimentitalea todarodis]|uniref:Mechanosensitive ion channel n=2 Tax=Sedimentitalea todarodis TaxID=1631240 RepID=A0ABU3VAA2_9RHOB|nr:mechanosensitive ion channel domain-containing protein [Sedimentitalea todarodis]MDU9003106.1 mechanosensitive ion channel [Sedimentitalea todarodis]